MAVILVVFALVAAKVSSSLPLTVTDSGEVVQTVCAEVVSVVPRFVVTVDILIMPLAVLVVGNVT